MAEKRQVKTPKGGDRLSVTLRPQVHEMIGLVSQAEEKSESAVVAELAEAGLVLRKLMASGNQIKVVDTDGKEMIMFGMPSLRVGDILKK